MVITGWNKKKNTLEYAYHFDSFGDLLREYQLLKAWEFKIVELLSKKLGKTSKKVLHTKNIGGLEVTTYLYIGKETIVEKIDDEYWLSMLLCAITDCRDVLGQHLKEKMNTMDKLKLDDKIEISVEDLRRYL